MDSILPTEIMIDGKGYAIDPSTENCIDIMQLFEDPDVTETAKYKTMLAMLYLDPPPYCEESLRAAVDFLNGGEEPAQTAQSSAPKRRYYSFTQDLKYIRSAVQRTHGVNLREKWDLHWWVFIEMFMELDENCTFSQMLYLRQGKAKNRLSKEEKKRWREMKDILVLKDTQSEAERTAVEEQLAYLEGLSG